MDKIHFDIEYINPGENTHVFNMLYPLTAVTHVYINDTDLLALVREAELPYATQEGHPNMAGGYIGLKPSKLLWPSNHLLGEPEPEYEDDDDKIAIYGCVCGNAGCWPLLVRVEVGMDTIRWSDFEQPHRGPDSAAGQWHYDHLGPFTFDRKQYENALEALW